MRPVQVWEGFGRSWPSELMSSHSHPHLPGSQSQAILSCEGFPARWEETMLPVFLRGVLKTNFRVQVDQEIFDFEEFSNDRGPGHKLLNV